MSLKLVALGALLSATLLVSPAFAARQGVLVDDVYTVTVGAEDPDMTLNPDDVSALGADNTLVKMGKGRLIINCNLGATYDGEIIVREGFLRATCGEFAKGTGTHLGLGGTTKGTFVEKGATLELVGASGQNECANTEPLTFEGAGVDGCGAVYRVSGCNTGYGLFANSTITMTGNATVGSKTSGCWFRIRNTAINMNGYDLTFQNADTANGFKGGGNSGPVTNPGNIIVAEGAAFCLENQNSKIVTGTAENELILKANSKFVQATAVGARCKWTLQVDGTAQLTLNANPATGTYGWDH